MQIDIDENVFKVYAISVAVLMAKMLLMSLLTARQRFKHMVICRIYTTYTSKISFLQILNNVFVHTSITVTIRLQVFANPEDAAGMDKAKVIYTNEGVERYRRCHQNDIENIFPFIILSGVYVVLAGPSLFEAKCVFYGFTASRLVHMIVYLNQVSNLFHT